MFRIRRSCSCIQAGNVQTADSQGQDEKISDDIPQGRQRETIYSNETTVDATQLLDHAHACLVRMQRPFGHQPMVLRENPTRSMALQQTILRFLDSGFDTDSVVVVG